MGQKKKEKKDKTGPTFSHQNESKTKNKSKTKTAKDLTAPRSGRGESLFLIMGRCRERQGHLGEARVDMSLNHMRGGGREWWRDRPRGQEGKG